MRKGGCPEGSAEWEIHSTPGRDGMITLLMDHLHKIIESNHLDPESVKEKMEGIRFKSPGTSRSPSTTSIRTTPGSPRTPRIPSKPAGPEEMRDIFSQMKTAKSSIVFIERRYRKRDPKYADFSIRQQREILRRLQMGMGQDRLVKNHRLPGIQERNRGGIGQRWRDGEREKQKKFQITNFKPQINFKSQFQMAKR